MSLTEIQKYYSDSLVKFKDSNLIDGLSKETTYILYQIGLPNHHTFGGDYEFFGNVELLDNKYLKFGTKNTFFNEPFALCIDIKTEKIIGRTHYSEEILTYTINKDLKTYLEYIYTFTRFHHEIKIPQTLGEYYLNHKKYAHELKNRLISVEKNDVNTDFWHSSIEEMELGFI
ncbi:hypothetical protein [Flavobacterium sp. S87F.05.LMB.W.Kidney.N]|uniref:hypothetical protein n=1 Tax=Flavobacterium sp. S87F.05.LMB.W.Kidney.N TaxID=1278758 RepID=UPI0010657F67|nr:hypothetical protein [Flavobacterium sp. S87F.05.LMB.W.Kidney.N]TDX11192.1 hypothetical protein EDB96_1970 [Flavobacterium sp. S87F.05.LMB.W.Kidney.N]